MRTFDEKLLTTSRGQADILYWLGYAGLAEPENFTELTDDECDHWAARAKPTSTVLEIATAKLQDFMLVGFPGAIPEREFGQFGPATRKLMGLRKCACPDVRPAGACLRKFAFDDPRYYVPSNYRFPGIDYERAKELEQLALDMWAEVAGVKARVVDDSDAEGFVTARRIDGSGRTLAWQQLPGCGSGRGAQLEGRTDSSEDWARDIMGFYVPTRCHELGHWFGLDHHPNRDALMFWAINGTRKPHLQYDGAPMRQRYGDPQEPPPPQPQESQIEGEFFAEAVGDRIAIRSEGLRPKAGIASPVEHIIGYNATTGRYFPKPKPTV